jgi:Uma2 family endonuclease
MFMPVLQTRRWTADEVRALPDEPGKRFECVHGELLVSPADLQFDESTLVQPDVFVLPFFEGRRPVRPEQIGHALLFVEVISPGTARCDRVVKRTRYQRYGVEYWIVDLDARLVERWMPDAERPEIITGALDWQPSGSASSLTINLDALFAEALGER